MAPPVAVYVVATIVGIGAVIAFKEYVYEPHLAPRIEAWAENFLQRRRAARNRRPSAVPVRASRQRRASASSDPSDENGDHQRQAGQSDRAPGAPGLNNPSTDELELEALVSREVDEWRNEVLRSQERTKNGLRKRRTSRLVDDSDGFDTMSTTLDESFTSLSHTPLASTHVISNVSSPMTASTVSLPLSPPRPRSESQSTTMQGDVVFPESTASRPTDAVANFDVVFPSPLAIPHPARRSSAADGVPRPLPHTPTYQFMAEESPFGPLLPDTPRSSAEMYGEWPFSPITSAMAPSSGYVSAAGPKGQLRRSSGIFRKSSGLANEVKMGGSDDGSDPHVSMSTSTLPGPETNRLVFGSLSERYPAPPTPPVMVSPPASSIGIISAPSSPRSGSSEVVVQAEAITVLHPTTLPLLQLPPDSSSPGLISRSRSSALSPAISDASFLSPIPFSRTASESEADEFLSVASDDSDWGMSPVSPSRHAGGPVHDRNNPFLDFEHLTRGARGGSVHGDGSEGSEVLVGHEAGSETGSEESWGSARRR